MFNDYRTWGKYPLISEIRLWKYNWGSRPIVLRGEDARPRQISYNGLFSLIGSDQGCELFEVIQTPPDIDQFSPAQKPLQPHPQLAAVLGSFGGVFAVPDQLPPPRMWDHKIHLPAGTRLINVRPYRYPYFQKTEIERQVKDMLQQGVI